MRFAPSLAFRGSSLFGVALGLLCATAGAGPGGLDTPAKRGRALRNEATRLLNLHQVAAACGTYEAALQLLPTDPDVVVDLALCEQRLGNTEKARDANRKAITLASAPEQIQDPHFARIRRSGYFNLRQLPDAIADSSSTPGAALGSPRLAAEAGCSKAFTVCSARHTTGGSGGSQSSTVVQLALDDADECSEDDDSLDASDFDAQAAAALPASVSNGGTLTFNEAYDSESFDYICAADEWSCEKSATVAAAVEKCVLKSGAGSERHCQELECARAEKRPSRAVASEQREAQNSADECYKNCADFNESYECSIAYANACTGLVGIVCHGQKGDASREWTSVQEFAFEQGGDK